MSARGASEQTWASKLAWALWALGMLSLVLSIVLTALVSTGPGADAPVMTLLFTLVISLGLGTFATVGALVASRLPYNPIGWLFLIIGSGLGNLASAYSDLALKTHPGSLPGGEVATWVYRWEGWSIFPLLGFVLLLFPNGRLPSRRWKPFALLGAVATLFFVLALMFTPGPLLDPGSVRNPFGIEALRAFQGWTDTIGLALMAPFLLASAASLLLRFRRAQGEERQQLKWLATAAASVALVFALGPLVFWLVPNAEAWWGLAIFLTWTAFPVSVAFAILRYRLYDLNLIVRSTLVYGLLTAALLSVYFGGVALLREMVLGVGRQGDSQTAVVASTLAVAALFQPMRRRIQAVIDRRFYRRKYDATQTLQNYSTSLRDEVDLEALTHRLVGVVQETVQPTHVTFWLRDREASK